MRLHEKRLLKLLNGEYEPDYVEDSVVYCIKYNNIPIYIGSTKNLKKREGRHNKCLNRKGSETKEWYYHLYEFLRLNGVSKIKLEIIKSFKDIKEGHNFKRYIIEEEAINYCIDKGIKLLNVKYPCLYTENGSFLSRRIDEKFRLSLT